MDKKTQSKPPSLGLVAALVFLDMSICNATAGEPYSMLVGPLVILRLVLELVNKRAGVEEVYNDLLTKQNALLEDDDVTV